MKVRNVDLELISNSRNESCIQVTINNEFSGSAGSDNLNTIMKEMPNVSINFLNKILNKGLNGWDVNNLKDVFEIEELLLSYDGTRNLGKIGSNFLLALDFALLKMASNNDVLKLLSKRFSKVPQHMCNCIVTNYTEKSRRFQEFFIMPKVKKFTDGYFANSFIYSRLRNLLKNSERTDEGSFVTELKNESVLLLLEKVIGETTKKLGVEFSLGVNFNSENIYGKGNYKVGKQSFSLNEFLKEINKLISRFDVDYLEDTLNKENISEVKKVKSSYVSGNKIFNGDLENLKKYAKYFNCCVLKLNEVGSLKMLKKIADFCKNNDISLVLEQNLGETNDISNVDIAVGFDFDFVKYGVHGKERIMKLQELKRIEQEL
ncbi:MAG: hypothetical protein AABW58_02980 [Nanoarchaeota archaeon]